VRLDRKLLLIAPTIVLVFVAAGMIYASMQMHVLADVSRTLDTRRNFIAAVERGEKPLEQRQAISIIKAQFDVEDRRSSALNANRDLLELLSGIALASIAMLAFAIRSVPRRHWPRFASAQSKSA
jgi:hypothetical protein